MMVRQSPNAIVSVIMCLLLVFRCWATMRPHLQDQIVFSGEFSG
jgi:hypothetical protein